MAGATPHAAAELRAPGPITGPAGDKDALLQRMHRIEGQVRGIERMVNEDRSCVDILMRIAAVKTALEHFGANLLEGHVTRCIADALAARDKQTAHVKTADMIHAVQRFVKTQ